MAENKKPFQLDKETLVIIGVMCLVFLWTVDRIFSDKSPKQEGLGKPNAERMEIREEPNQVDKANVPLATGKEPIDKIFIQSGCAACHTIPGIAAARGREGPKLELGTNARKMRRSTTTGRRPIFVWAKISSARITGS